MTRYVKICPGCGHHNPTSANNCEADGEPLLGVNTQAETTVAQQTAGDEDQHDGQTAVDHSAPTVSQPAQTEQAEAGEGNGAADTSRYVRKCPNCGHLNRADAWTCETDDTFLGSIEPQLETDMRVEGGKNHEAKVSDSGRSTSNRNVEHRVQVGLDVARASVRRSGENTDNGTRGGIATDSGGFPKRPQFASSSNPTATEQNGHAHRPDKRARRANGKMLRRMRSRLPAITRKRVSVGLVIVASLAANFVLLYAWHPWSANQNEFVGYTGTEWITSSTPPVTREGNAPPTAGAPANGYRTHLQAQLARSRAATVSSTPARPATSGQKLGTVHSEQFATGTEIYRRYIGENP